MTNLEIANTFLYSVHTFVHVQSSEDIPSAYAAEVEEAALSEVQSGLHTEYVSLEEVESFFDYITQNLLEQVQHYVPLNRDYESLTLSFTFTKK